MTTKKQDRFGPSFLLVSMVSDRLICCIDDVADSFPFREGLFIAPAQVYIER